MSGDPIYHVQLATTGISMTDALSLILRKRAVAQVLRAWWTRGQLDHESYRIAGGSQQYLASLNLVREVIQNEYELMLLIKLFCWDIGDMIRRVHTPLHIPVSPSPHITIPSSFMIDDVERYSAAHGDVMFVLPCDMIMDQSTRYVAGTTLNWKAGDSDREWKLSGGDRDIRVKASTMRVSHHVYSLDQILPVGAVADSFTPITPRSDLQRVGNGILSTTARVVTGMRNGTPITIEWRSMEVPVRFRFLHTLEGYEINAVLLNELDRLIRLDQACGVIESLLWNNLLYIDRRIISMENEVNVQIILSYLSPTREDVSRIGLIRMMSVEYDAVQEILHEWRSGEAV